MLGMNLGDNYFITRKDDSNFIIGWNPKNVLKINREDQLSQIDDFLSENSGEYIFTALNYDLKNAIYPSISSKNSDCIGFPLAVFIVCEHVLLVEDGAGYYFGKSSISALNELDLFESFESENNSFDLHPFIDKEHYRKHFNAIHDEIQFGNIYEINYCVSQAGRIKEISPKSLIEQLIKATDAPFSFVYKLEHHLVISNSPERFVHKNGNHLISMPIKGTRKRGSTTTEDKNLIQELAHDAKEISENVMIVDLVRNDLSKLAQKDSVNVLELCKVYSFKTVHQLISTIECRLKTMEFQEMLKAMFPMGSMTGAPKLSAMEISEREENFKRGIYSGSLGFIEPNGNYDFNVVIRSFIANLETGNFMVPVGGALTIKAKAEQEYEECLVKLNSVKSQLC